MSHAGGNYSGLGSQQEPPLRQLAEVPSLTGQSVYHLETQLGSAVSRASSLCQDVEKGGDASPRTARLPNRPRDSCTQFIQSWASRKFLLGCAILFPVVVTAWVSWWFFCSVDAVFSPVYLKLLGFRVYGLGFITSMVFILGVGVFFSSWLGSALLNLGELIIKRLPLVRHIYSASKQVSAALNPENEAAKAFQECVLVRHPRIGELALAFVTGSTVLQMGNSDVKLLSLYVPTNHVYVGDIFFMEEKEVIHTNLSVREGLEIVVSVGMAVPPTLIATKL